MMIIYCQEVTFFRSRNAAWVSHYVMMFLCSLHSLQAGVLSPFRGVRTVPQMPSKQLLQLPWGHGLRMPQRLLSHCCRRPDCRLHP